MIESVAMRDADSTGVVAHKDSRRLRMPEVSENGPKTGGVLSSSKEGGIFSFTCAGHDAGDDGGEGVNSAVDLQG